MKEDNFKFLPAVLETVAEHVDKPVHINGVLESFIELLLWVALAALFKQSPCNRLGILYKGAESLNIKGIILNHCTCGVILKAGPVAGIGCLLPTAFGRD